MERKQQLVEAQHLFILGEYRESLELMNKLIDSSKTYEYNLLMYRALIQWKLNNYPEMIGDAERVNSLNNSRFEGHYLLAVGLLSIGKYADAVKAIQRAKLILIQADLEDPRRTLISQIERKIVFEKARFKHIGKSKAEVERLISGAAVDYDWK